MSLLLYCAAPADNEGAGIKGVGGRPLDSLAVGQVRFFFSPAEPDDIQAPARFQHAALEFFETGRLLFEQSAIIPFRFPTVMRSRDELDAYVGERAALFAVELDRFQGKAQMEVVLPPPAAADTPAKSGTEYLRARQHRSRAADDLVSAVREMARGLTLDSTVLTSVSGVRICFLLARPTIPEFRKRFADRRDLRVTGPWPPAAFISPALQPEEVRRG